MVPNKKRLEDAIKARDEFLEQNPKLKEFQKEIDEVLDKCNEQDRTGVVSMLMVGKMAELQTELMKLSSLLTNGK